MKTQNQTQDPFRSRRERESEVNLVQKYRGIGIAAVAAAGSRVGRLSTGAQPASRAGSLVEAVD
ncbi:hypothetical protein NDN16_15940 [Aureimonas altamirensis]|uniref:hypothetical protein n=1 Tax=Aureimonas altamirensis TaxID=370622 RepID=UPI0020366EC0|nr:hypothetical protein [Aureimonas altamirensis]MCM2505162.1 hypothetical protein [Aureimonas altamirensis]